MTRVIGSGDCGNSPKNLLIQALSVALAKGDTDSILGKVADDIRWDRVGDRVVQGSDDVGAALARVKAGAPDEIAIRHVVTHGKAGAVNGTKTSKGGDVQAFCDVYESANTKGTIVKEITSYVIKLKQR